MADIRKLIAIDLSFQLGPPIVSVGHVMSIEFLAGFISGVAGLIVGSPLDVIKTIDQSTETRTRISLYEPKTWFAGLLMPTLG